MRKRRKSKRRGEIGEMGGNGRERGGEKREMGEKVKKGVVWMERGREKR